MKKHSFGKKGGASSSNFNEKSSNLPANSWVVHLKISPKGKGEKHRLKTTSCWGSMLVFKVVNLGFTLAIGSNSFKMWKIPGCFFNKFSRLKRVTLLPVHLLAASPRAADPPGVFCQFPGTTPTKSETERGGPGPGLLVEAEMTVTNAPFLGREQKIFPHTFSLWFHDFHDISFLNHFKDPPCSLPTENSQTSQGLRSILPQQKSILDRSMTAYYLMQMPFDDFWTSMSTIQEQSRGSLLRLFETSLSIFYTVSPALYPSFSVWNYRIVFNFRVSKFHRCENQGPENTRLHFLVGFPQIVQFTRSTVWYSEGWHLTKSGESIYALGMTLTYLYHLPVNSETSAEITYQHLSTLTKIEETSRFLQNLTNL